MHVLGKVKPSQLEADDLDVLDTASELLYPAYEKSEDWVFGVDCLRYDKELHVIQKGLREFPFSK